jgi:hypothetical protein
MDGDIAGRRERRKMTMARPKNPGISPMLAPITIALDSELGGTKPVPSRLSDNRIAQLRSSLTMRTCCSSSRIDSESKVAARRL